MGNPAGIPVSTSVTAAPTSPATYIGHWGGGNGNASGTGRTGPMPTTSLMSGGSADLPETLFPTPTSFS